MTSEQISHFLDALDELHDGICLVDLIGMTTRHPSCSDHHALAAGVRVALDRLQAAQRIFKLVQDKGTSAR
jgi:hypothetical protein